MDDLSDLRNVYSGQGKKALLLATGPSINLFKDIFQNIPDDYVVFCIKSAIDVIPHGRCDYHLLNNLKLKKYRYRVRKPFVVYASMGKKEYRHADLRIKLKGPSIARTKAYDEILEFDSVKRWGPGIMYDVAIPFVHFLGFSSVYICGWDLFPLGQATNLHFDGKYGHNKTRKPCRFEGKYVNESDLINLMSGPVYDACVKENFDITLLTHGNVCNVSRKIPRLFCPLFGFDPYMYLVQNYEDIPETSLECAWEHAVASSASASFSSLSSLSSASLDVFYLQYLASYTDLTQQVLENIIDYDHRDYDIILQAMVNMAEYHYNDVGKMEILSGKRRPEVFDPWCYMASYREMKKDYWDIFTNSLNFKTILYTWLTVGYPLELNNNLYNLKTKEAKKIMYLQIM